MENSGYPFLSETIALMYRYPQVYGDLSTGTWIYPRETFHNYLRGLMDAGLGKRIMFGSDQMQWPEVIDDAIDAIDGTIPERRAEARHLRQQCGALPTS